MTQLRIGSGKSDVIFNGIFSADYIGNHLDLNLEATRLGAINDGEADVAYGWAIAASRNLNESWGIFGELSGVYRRGVAPQSQFLAGVNYNFSKRVVFDVGAATGLASASQDWTMFAGVTVLVGRLW